MSAQVRFMVGDQILYQHSAGEVRFSASDIIVITFADGRSETFSRDVLEKAFTDQQLQYLQPSVVVRSQPRLTTGQLREFARREAYLTALAAYPKPNAQGVREEVIAAVSARIGDSNPPAPSTLSRWQKERSDAGGDTLAQILRNTTRRSRLSGEIEDLISAVIDEIWLKENEPTASYAYEIFRSRFKERGYTTKPPAFSTFLRRVNRVPLLIRVERRKGKAEAQKEARIAGMTIDAAFPLERVEVDTMHANLGLLDDDGHYVGAVTVYLVIDVYSRAILGYALHVGKRREEPASAIHALRYAITPKDDPAYPMHGMPRGLVTDSGAAYKDKDYTRFVSQICDQRVVAPPYQAWAKPFVERFIGSVRKQLFQNLRGYLGKRDPKRYSGASIKKSATYTVTEFREILHRFIVDKYHHTPHDGLKGKTPFQMWQEGIRDVPPMLPQNLSDFAKLRGLRANDRALSRVQGVGYDYQRFQSPALQALFDVVIQRHKGKDNPTIDILVDPLDAGAITAINPLTLEEIEVPNTNAAAAGRSFAELNAWRRSGNRSDEAPLFQPDNIREEVRTRPNRRGPDVDLDADDNQINVDDLRPDHDAGKGDDSHSNLPRTRPNEDPDADDDADDDDSAYELM